MTPGSRGPRESAAPRTSPRPARPASASGYRRIQRPGRGRRCHARIGREAARARRRSSPPAAGLTRRRRKPRGDPHPRAQPRPAPPPGPAGCRGCPPAPRLASAGRSRLLGFAHGGGRTGDEPVAFADPALQNVERDSPVIAERGLDPAAGANLKVFRLLGGKPGRFWKRLSKLEPRVIDPDEQERLVPRLHDAALDGCPFAGDSFFGAWEPQGDLAQSLHGSPRSEWCVWE